MEGLGIGIALGGTRIKGAAFELSNGDLIFEDHEIDDYMVYTALNMIIFQQFRHALTRHDPKTYIP